MNIYCEYFRHKAVSSTDNEIPTRQTIMMTKLSLSFLIESDKTFTFFLDRKCQPLLSPLHQGFLLPGSMVMIPSFFKEFGEPPYQRPHCPPHLLYCILSILTPPSSVRLFIKIGPWKFSMFTLSVTCLSRLLS